MSLCIPKADRRSIRPKLTLQETIVLTTTDLLAGLGISILFQLITVAYFENGVVVQMTEGKRTK